MSDNILITGGCGFIGTSLVDTLLRMGNYSNIRILDNFKEGKPEDLSEVTSYTLSTAQECTEKNGVVLIEGDIRDYETVRKVTEGVSTIIHLAANTGVPVSVQFPRMDMESNIVGTFNMLEAARENNIPRFVFASSGAPAGIVEPPIHEELPAHPVSPYGASKLAGEGYCSAYYQTFGIGTVALRFGNVFGPRSKKKSSVVAKFIRQALQGEVCEIYGDGKQTRDFIYIDDLIHAIVLSMEKDVGGEVFQIASGTERTVEEIVMMIRDNLKANDIDMQVKHGSVRKGDIQRNYSDTTKARKILGWEPQVGLANGVQKTVDYFIELSRSGEIHG